MTVLEVIQRSSEFLARKGVDSPRLQIELLLAHVLQMPRMKLYLDFERALSPSEIETVRELVKRRGEREPLQHIVGSVSFCGLEIAVDRNVLIPRPETELLAEHAEKFLGNLGSEPAAVLDFGTGSGCLAVVIAARHSSARVHAIDISENALGVARRNAERHGLADRIQFCRGDGLSAVAAELKFNLIVSNPPYIPTNEIAALQPEVRDHDPVLALDGGADGLDFYRRLAREGGPRLRDGGRLMLELGDGQAPAVSDLLVANGWSVERVEKDYSGRDRILIARRVN
jgi:release factor glutamine methyltransferase